MKNFIKNINFKNRALSIILLVAIAFTVVQVALALAPIPNPGHDISTLGGYAATGDLIYGTNVATGGAAGLSDVTAGSALISNGANAVPIWGKITEAHLNLTDLTTGNVSTTAHGFAPKAPNNTTTFLRGDGTWAAPTAAATPAGVNTSVQVNDNGVMGGSTDFAFDKTSNSLILNGADTEITMRGITTEPSAPAAGTLHLYSKAIAGRMMPKWKAPAGVDITFQPSLGFNRIAVVNPAGGTSLSTFVNAFGTAFTNVGATISNPTPVGTNALTSTRRASFGTGTTAGLLASHRQNTLMVWRGNNVTNAPGGFFFVIRFGLSALQSGMRAFVGLADSVAAPTNVDPTTTTTPGKVGLAINANSGNWNFVHNVTGTAPTITALGASFPVNATDLYELVLYSKPNDTVINYRVTDISTNATVTGATLTTNIPAATTFLAPLMWITNNATAANTAIDLGGWYLESDQ
jgi:hypothetical protein